MHFVDSARAVTKNVTAFGDSAEAVTKNVTALALRHGVMVDHIGTRAKPRRRLKV